MDREEEMLLDQEWRDAVLRFFGLTEAVRSDQSFEQLHSDIEDALNEWPQRPGERMIVMWVFSDRLIAAAWRLLGQTDEKSFERHIWEIEYSRADSTITFGTVTEVSEIQLYEPMAESVTSKDGVRLQETTEQVLESIGPEGSARKVKGIGISSDVVNGNGRRYPRKVLANAVAALNTHLHESNGQGRLVLTTGEAEHPSQKGGRPSLLETIVKWEAVSLAGNGQVLLEGAILPTSKGKDVAVLVENKVPVGISMRGYGQVRQVEESGQEIDEVTALTITGFDLVARPSDPNAGITESIDEPSSQKTSSKKEDKPMDLQAMIAALKADPNLLESLQKSLGLEDPKAIAESLGGKSLEQIQSKLEEAAKIKEEQAARELRESIDNAITEATKGLKFGDEMNKLFVEAVRAAKPESVEAVKPLVEGKIKEYEGMAAVAKLAAMGKKPNGPVVEGMSSAFEEGTGQPEYTVVAYRLNESVEKAGEGHHRDLRKGVSPAELFAVRSLERFDKLHQAKLVQEARMFNEAEQTSDLNLPYSVARTIIEQAYPELVAANVYDFGTTDMAPARIYYEYYAGESGSSAAVTNEAATSSEGAWVSLSHKRVRPGTVTITGSGATPTYVEGTDYVVDYEEGKVYTLAAGSIGDGTTLEVDYTYDAYRLGEMQAIPRAKNTLATTSLEIAADRLAMEISNEAIVFSRSQMGYDAVTRTLGNLARLVRRKIDKDILYKGLAASLIQANNSGGTFNSASDDVTKLVEYMGYARVKVYNRFYMPTAFIMSVTNADRLSNWEGFRNNGFPNATLSAAGFAGGLKGLPVFMSTEYSDAYVQAINRELVMHRVYQPMVFRGPFPSYSNGQLVGADQYYAEEFNGSLTPVVEKTAHILVT